MHAVAAAIALTSAACAQARLLDFNTSPQPAESASSNPAFFARLGNEVTFWSGAPGFVGTWGELDLYRTDGTAAGTRFVHGFRQHPDENTPFSSLTLGTRTVFKYMRADTGIELWVTDGTDPGTRLLRDFWPGPRGGITWSGPLVGFQGLAWFVADDPLTGFELWRTDGTDPGTQLAVDIWQGPGGGGPAEIVVVGPRMFMTAADGAYGRELWVSDGTPAGTQMVADLSMYSSIANLKPLGNGVVFTTVDRTLGEELFFSDGTAVGTFLVRDIAPGAASSSPRSLQLLGNRVVFETPNTPGAMQLWQTDGTTAGTTLVQPQWPNTYHYPIACDQTLFAWVAANNTGWDLWRYDVSLASAALVMSTPPMSGNFLMDFLPLVDGLAVIYDDGVHGREPWFVPPQGAPILIGDVRPGSEGSDATRPAALGDELWFAANDGVHGKEPWVYSRTTGIARMVADVAAPESSSWASPLGAIGQDLILTARTGATTGGLWRTDGTPQGTVNLLTANQLRASLVAAEPSRLWLLLDDGVHGQELWRTDGTVAGTALVADLSAGAASSYVSVAVAVLGGRLLFAKDWELWSSDGTATGTAVLVPGLSTSGVVQFGDIAVFSGSQSGAGSLWRSDGTAAGTWPIGGSPSTAPVIALDAFVLCSGGGGLWRTDGTAAGTSLVLSQVGLAGGIARLGNAAVFSAADAAHGTELWISDGTTAGTHLLLDISPGTASGNPRALRTAGDRVFFVATEAATGTELWVTDGTSSGTHIVLDVEPGMRSSMLNAEVATPWPPGQSLIDNRRLLFLAEDAAHGAEPWITDGTAAGTYRLADSRPGSRSSEANWFARAGNMLYWRGHDVPDGYELWGMLLATGTMAAASEYGSPCAAAQFVPRIATAGIPRTGEAAFAVELRAAPPLAGGLLVLGARRADLALGLCTLHPALPTPTAFFVTDVVGRASAPVPIPNDPGFLGAEFHAQWLVVEPGGPVFGVASMSTALHLLIGG